MYFWWRSDSVVNRGQPKLSIQIRPKPKIPTLLLRSIHKCLQCLIWTRPDYCVLCNFKMSRCTQSKQCSKTAYVQLESWNWCKMTVHCAGTAIKCSSEELIEAAWTQFLSAHSLTVSAETETCHGATYGTENETESELFTNFGTKTETKICSISSSRTCEWSMSRAENGAKRAKNQVERWAGIAEIDGMGTERAESTAHSLLQPNISLTS